MKNLGKNLTSQILLHTVSFFICLKICLQYYSIIYQSLVRNRVSTAKNLDCLRKRKEKCFKKLFARLTSLNMEELDTDTRFNNNNIILIKKKQNIFYKDRYFLFDAT